MTISGAAAPVELWMPVWTPGAYELRTWGRNVTPVGASDEAGRKLAVARTGPSTFRVDGGGTIRVRYRVYAAKLSDDGSQVDAGHALLNGSSILLAVRGQERGLHELRIELPSGWRAATALEEDAGGGWSATSYEQIIDGPIECGRFVDATARADGRSYRIVVDGAPSVPARFVDDVGRIAAAEARIAGAPPYHRYVVVVHLADEAGRVAALEHAASTSIIVPKKSFADPDAYDELIYVVAHELFHAWNAKRLRPAELVPYDLLHAQLSRSLWITEGLTEYFAHRAMLASGRWNRAAYLAHVSDEAARADEAARVGLSVEQAAELTWQPPDDTADDWDAYYARGHLIALAVDAAMRVRTGGKHTLDEVLRGELLDAERAGGIAPIDSARLARAVDALAPGAGALLTRSATEANETGDIRAAIAAIGLSLQCAASARVVAGFSAEREGDSLRVVAVGDGGPADLAGLKPGDRILSLDGAAPALRWPDKIAHAAAGAPLVLDVTRGQRPLELHLTLETEQDSSCKLTQAPATPAITKLREQLLTP